MLLAMKVMTDFLQSIKKTDYNDDDTCWSRKLDAYDNDHDGNDRHDNLLLSRFFTAT